MNEEKKILLIYKFNVNGGWIKCTLQTGSTSGHPEYYFTIHLLTFESGQKTGLSPVNLGYKQNSVYLVSTIKFHKTLPVVKEY